MNIWLGRGGLLSGVGALGFFIWALLTQQDKSLVWIYGIAAVVLFAVNLWIWRRR